MGSRIGVALLVCAIVNGTECAVAHDGAKFEPADGKILHGALEEKPTLSNYSDALNLASGSDALHPLLTKMYFPLWGRYTKQYVTKYPFPLTVQEMVDLTVNPVKGWLEQAQSKNAMPEISVNFELYQGMFGEPSINAGALDPVIDELAKLIKDFKNPCFVRPGYEPNTTHYLKGHFYIDAYRRIVDRLRAAGVENAAFIWCSGPGDGASMEVVGNWFPGDAYVDWVGVDLFHPEHFLPQGGNRYPKTLTTMLELANGWHKPIMISESSAVFPGGIVDPSPAAAEDYWNTWFEPFFAMMESNPRIKGFCYIDWNWPTHGFPWVDSRIENNPYLVAKIAERLGNGHYLHRDSPNKFPRPYLTDLGATVQLGSAGDPVYVTLAGQNANDRTLPPGTPIQVAWFFSASLVLTPGSNPNLLNYVLGNPVGKFGGSSTWFLAPPCGLLFASPAALDGSFEDRVRLPPGFTSKGEIFYLQAVVDRAGELCFTQPFVIEVVP